MVCGSGDFIAEARRYCKMLGGQMRQAGVIAAAGIVALEQMIERLEEDHQHAHLLGDGLRQIRGLSVMPENIQTNIVFFRLLEGENLNVKLMTRLGEIGVRVLPMGPWLRAVTHYGIGREDVRIAVTQIEYAVTDVLAT